MRGARRSALGACVLLALTVPAAASATPATPTTPAATAVRFAPNVVHTETMRVGEREVSVQFTGDWPPLAQKSLDIIFAPGQGTRNLHGSFRVLGPDGRTELAQPYLPRYPRDARYWGLDSTAIPSQGPHRLVLTIGQDSGTLTFPVGPAPDGPPRPLITLMALLPALGVLLLAVRAWWRVRPLRHVDARRL